MGVVGFAVLFAGVVSSVLAGATTSLLLAFILPVTLAGPASSIPDRLEGWAMASGAALLAVALLWPTPTRGPLRDAATAACRRWRRGCAPTSPTLSGEDEALRRTTTSSAVEQADAAVEALRRVFLATPYRPASLSTAGRDDRAAGRRADWLSAIVDQAARPTPGAPRQPRGMRGQARRGRRARARRRAARA